MKDKFVLIPFKKVGEIGFVMTIENVKEILGKYDSIDINKKTDIRWKNLSIKFKKNVIYDMTFSAGPLKIIYNDMDLLADKNLDKTLDKIESSNERLGYKVYFSLGIAITGFSKPKEKVSITIFPKTLSKFWTKFIADK